MENREPPATGASPWTIRPAQPGDEQGLFVLIGELARFEKLEHLVTGTPSDLAQHLFSTSPSAEALVALRAHRLVGYALFFPTFSTFLARPGLWLEDLFVTESERGQGLGKRLLLQVAAIARQRKAARLEWAVLDWNTRAIDFYEALGATVMPDWRVCRVTGTRLANLGTDSG